jgi:hypothetical protein
MMTQLSRAHAGTAEPLLLRHGVGSTHDDLSALRRRLDTAHSDLPVRGESAPLSERPAGAAIAIAIGPISNNSTDPGKCT